MPKEFVTDFPPWLVPGEEEQTLKKKTQKFYNSPRLESSPSSCPTFKIQFCDKNLGHLCAFPTLLRECFESNTFPNRLPTSSVPLLVFPLAPFRMLWPCANGLRSSPAELHGSNGFFFANVMNTTFKGCLKWMTSCWNEVMLGEILLH